MHSHFLDTYSHLESPVHRLPTSVKLFSALVTIVALVALPPMPAVYVLVGFALVMVAAATGIPGPFLLKRMIFLEPFVLGVAVLTLFERQGAIAFLTLATRSTLCLLTVILLSNTAPFSDLLAALKRAGLPAIMITTIALMYRYLYVLKGESDRMRAARASRTFTDGRRRSWATLGNVIGHLFVRSTARAERIYLAMCARGWE